MARKTTTVKKASDVNGGTLTAMPPVTDQAVRDLAQAGELHVTDLCNRLGQSQPAVSHHLALLRVSGLIESRREGKHNFYSVRGNHFGQLLVDLFSSTGPIPKKIRFHDFVLNYEGA